MKIKSLYKEKSNTEFEKNILHKVDGEVSEVETELLAEHYTTLFINDVEVATLVCTGTSIVELAIGRIISEGILTDINSIDSIYICEHASRARVYLKEGVEFINNVKKSTDVASCCQDNKSYFKSNILQNKLKNTLTLKDEDVFALATAFGVLGGKLMCWITKGKVNPMIGAAGVSAVPMAARVVHKEGQREDPSNFLLMHAMGPNVAGVIGSAVAAGVLLLLFL